MIPNPTVIIRSLGNAHTYGCYNHDNNVITVSDHDRIPNWRRRLALMHELFHWANRKYSINLTHAQVHLAAAFLTMYHKALLSGATKDYPNGAEISAFFKDPRFDFGDNVYREILELYNRVISRTILGEK